MKTFRFPVVLAAVILLLAPPAAADTRSAVAIDGPPPASIEGTISSLHAPIAGGGPIVSLLDGLVSLDATGAAVRFTDGTPGTTSDLAAGQRIAAFVDASASPLKATSIVVLLQRTDVALTGKVEAIDATARSFTILGFTVQVTDGTAFGGPRDGAGRSGLGELKVGELVLVSARADSGSLVATRVLKLSPAPTPTVRIHGTVDSIGTESWAIVLRDGSRVLVKVDAETKVVGNLAAGDEVDVLARREADGSLLAILIQKSVPPLPVPTERYHGIVKEIGPTAWTIGPRSGDEGNRVFAVSERTRIEGAPRVGDEVGVLAQKQADGTFLALLIAKVTVTPPVSEVRFEGLLKRMSLGLWLVDETRVLVVGSTVVVGRPEVGDRVRVEGLKQPDGTVLARRVTKI
jgi:hypothetical protein